MQKMHSQKVPTKKTRSKSRGVVSQRVSCHKIKTKHSVARTQMITQRDLSTTISKPYNSSSSSLSSPSNILKLSNNIITQSDGSLVTSSQLNQLNESSRLNKSPSYDTNTRNFTTMYPNQFKNIQTNNNILNNHHNEQINLKNIPSQNSSNLPFFAPKKTISSKFGPKKIFTTQKLSFSSSNSQSNISQMSDLNEFICIDAFCARQFEAGCESGSINYNKDEFLVKVKELINERIKNGEDLQTKVLVEGYAPFCKHIFIENFTDATPTAIAITDENKGYITTSYVARTEHELPVLSRFITAKDYPSMTVPKAKYLDLILYSREQIKIENEAMKTTNTDTAEWGIISIKAQNEPFETPMQPITMMRNALGKDQGGSGVPLSREKYNESVKFWDNNVSLL